MEETNIEDYLGAKFKDFEVEPLPGSFNTVMEKVAVAKEKKRRAGFLFVLSGIAALLLVYVSLSVFEDTSNTTNSVIASKKHNSSKTEKINNALGHKLQENPSFVEQEITSIKIESRKLNATPKTEIKTPNNTLSLKEHNISAPNLQHEEPKQITSAFVSTQTQTDHKNDTFVEQQTNSAPPLVIISDKTIAGEKKINPAEALAIIPAEAIAQVNADVLQSIGFGMSFKAENNLVSSSSNSRAEKDLLRLQSSKFKARFFMGISCQALMMEQTYALNYSGNTDPIRYPAEFKSSYVEGRRKESSRSTVTMPGIIFGLSMQRFEIRATLGAFQMRDYEIIKYPEDSLTTGFTNTVVPFGTPGIQATRNASPNSQLYQGERCGNTFNYVYGSLGINGILRFYNFQLKPGVAVSYNRALKSTYALVDTNGYQKYKNATRHLNKDVYSVSLRCGISKRLSRLVEVQVSPVYLISLSSVFDETYFLSQRFNGFGIEGALIYKFPVKLGK